MNNVIKMQRKPKNFTKAEEVIEEMRREIFGSKAGYKELAARCELSHSTIGNLARGKTAWPRPKTMNALLRELGLELRLTKKG